MSHLVRRLGHVPGSWAVRIGGYRTWPPNYRRSTTASHWRWELGFWGGIGIRTGFGLVGHPRISGSQVCHLSLCPLHGPQYSELQDKVTSAETKVLEMETTVEDLQWDIEKLRKREQKLNKHLAEALEQVRFRRWVRWSLNRVLGALTSLLHTHMSISSLHSSILATMCLGALQASRGDRSHSACRR